MSLNNLKICSWNVRGLHKPIKRRTVLGFLKKEKVDLAFLQETYLEESKDLLKLKHSWIGDVFMTSYASNSRGVAILVNKNVAFRSTHVIKDREGRYVILRGTLFGKSVTFMNIYCPPGYPTAFLTKAFSEFVELSADYQYIGGDFNVHMSPLLDKCPPSDTPPSRQAKTLASICNDIDFVDAWRTLNPSSKAYTFFSNPHKCHTRLDYFFVPKRLLNSVSSCKIGSIIVSDHAPIYLEISFREINRFSRSWRLNSTLLNDDVFTTRFISEFKVFFEANANSAPDPSILWETIKVFSRGIIISYSANRRRQSAVQQVQLEGSLSQAEQEYLLSPSADTLRKVSAARIAVESMLSLKSNKCLKFAKQRLYESGDKPGKYLAYLAKKRETSQTIVSIKDSAGNITYETQTINDVFAAFYKKLYTSEQSEDAPQIMDDFFSSINLPVISDEQRVVLNAPITKAEIRNALTKLQSGKCAGPDGFGCEFFKKFQDLLIDPYLAMINHSLETGILPQSLREANITVILKKGKCSEECASYRPIALLNADLKLLSKILALRLENFLPDIINPQQTGFIKGRNSSDNVRRLLNVIQYMHSHNESGLVLSLDSEKAFDRIQWPYLFHTMSVFGLGDVFIQWVKILYNDPQAAVLTNGVRSKNFSLQRSNRQGCPLSPLLFAIAIEPFAQSIRQSPTISGVVVGEREHRINLYADDVLLFLTQPDLSVPAVMDVISKFGSFSGYKINFSKSEAMPLGSLKNIPSAPDPFPFRWSPNGFVYLGVHITPLFEQMYSANFTPLMDVIKSDLDRWASLPLSWLGRVALIKMNILPRLLYPLQMVPVFLTCKVVKIIEGWLSSFIWNKRRPRLKLAKLQLPVSEGGLELPNIKWYQAAANLRFVAAWIKGDEHSIWLDIEAAQCDCPLRNLLFVKDHATVTKFCKNPIVSNTLKAWRLARLLEGRAKVTSPLTSIQGNPDFPPGLNDPGFNTWRDGGVTTLGNLFNGPTLMSFVQIQQKYGLPRGQFFRFLQVRDFILRRTTLLTNIDTSPIERALSMDFTSGFISIFYGLLRANSTMNTLDTKRKWERDLGVEIADEDWCEIFENAKKLSVCNRAWSVQLRTIHRLQISPSLRHKMNPSLSPLCLKCKIEEGDYFHCIWSCHKIERYWLSVVRQLNEIFNMEFELDPLYLILGLPDRRIINKSHKRLFNLLTYAARKNILLSWINEKPPTKKEWHKIIMQCMPLEFLTCLLRSTTDTFYKIWDPYLRFIGPQLAHTLTLGFLDRSDDAADLDG